MKRFISLVLNYTIILSLFAFTPLKAYAQASESFEKYAWNGATQVYSASKGARYFRTKLLRDGTIGAVYYRSGMGNYFAKSTDGGLTFSSEVCLIENATDSKIPDSPFVNEANPLGRGRLEAQNPNFIEMPNGELWVFHRYNTFTGSPEEKPWSIYYASICYQKSSDGGKTWSEPEVMVECQREKPLNDTGSDYGFWEPDPYIINGKLFVYYADTYTPGNLNYQHIMYCTYDEATKSFTAPEIAQNGINHKSRDGMSVVTKLKDGSYAMVFESTKTGNTHNTFVIKMSVSKDGINWSHPVIVASPNKVLEQTAASSSERAVCASPYIITLPDGRVAISYQTTDRYSGIIPDRVSYRVGSQVTVSKKEISYDTFADISAFQDETDNMNATHYFTEIENGPDVLTEDSFSKSASLLYANGYLMIYYNTGNNTDAYTHTLGAVKVSYAKTSSENDYRKTESYIAFNKNNSTITEQNGTFALPGSTSTLLAADKSSCAALTNLYNSENYTLYNDGSYKASFDINNETISTVKTGKALLKETECMTAFTASVDIKGDSSTGVLQGGFGFHLQKDDFSTNYFNTSGYSVFVRRQATSLDRVEIVYRYCTKGANVYSYVAGSYTGLSADDLDTEFTLNLFVNEDKFYALLLNKDGKVIINAKEAPLDEKSTDKNPNYYPVGSLAIINHGTHTFSNISVVTTSQLVKTDYLRAKGTFTLSESGDNQLGFALRAQGSVNTSPGYSGYVIKLVKKDDYNNGKIVLQLTRYGTDSDGKKFVNLGNMKTYTNTTILGDNHACGAKIVMEAITDGNLLTVTLYNYDNRDIKSTYSFDLTTSSNGYDYYYSSGGFGIFNHSATNSYVSDVEFYTKKEQINKINSDFFTVYSYDDSVIFNDGAYLSTKETTKKMIHKNSVSADFTANATFEIGSNGKINSGIVFRSGNVGDNSSEMDGYMVAVVKTGATANKSRIKLELSKWVRTSDGGFTRYLKNSTLSLKNLYDTTTLYTALPEAKTSMLASAQARIRINLSVNGNNVTTNFDVVDIDGNTLSSSAVMTYDLSTELTVNSDSKYTSDSANTQFGAGSIGAYINRLGRLCDFNFTSGDSDSLNDKLIHTDHNHNGVAYTTLNSGAAENGSLVKVVTLPYEGCVLSYLTVTVNGNTSLLEPQNGEYSFTKQSGQTFINAVFSIYGDLNGDDRIDAADIVNMRKFLLNKIDLRISDGDLNKNGAIEMKDFVKLKKLVAGINA